LNGRRSSLPAGRSPRAGGRPSNDLRGPRSPNAGRESSPRGLNGRRSSLPAGRSPRAGGRPSNDLRGPRSPDAGRESSPRGLNARASRGASPRLSVVGWDARLGCASSGAGARAGLRPVVVPVRTGERVAEVGRGCLAVSLTRIKSQAAIARSSSVSTWIWVRLFDRLLPSIRNTSSTRSPSVLIRAACTPIRCCARTRAME